MRLFVITLMLLVKPVFASYQPIPLDGFADVIKHWKDATGKAQYATLSPHQITKIADNIILYQRQNGGWPKNVDPLRILQATEREAVISAYDNSDTTLDNRNTYPQIRYLAAAYQQTQRDDYKKSAIKGLRYILDNQYDNGGWAHSPPRTDGYYAHITIADEVMPGVLSLLRDIVTKHRDFTFISDALRLRCAQALATGDALLLKLQVKQNGVPTIWAGQYHADTLTPAAGRAYELPSLIVWESVAVVDYLMSIEQHSAEVSAAINHAIAWFKQHAFTQIEVQEVAIETTRFDYHTAQFDRVVVANENAPPIWARFYDLKNNAPIFARRDGTRVRSLADVDADRRTGYDWYGYWPQKLLVKPVESTQ